MTIQTAEDVLSAVDWAYIGLRVHELSETAEKLKLARTTIAQVFAENAALRAEVERQQETIASMREEIMRCHRGDYTGETK
jgi:hypothetical protein